jgi:chromosome segregation ATPase
MTEEEYPEFILNYIATEALISEEESELEDLDVDLANHENRLEHLLDMIKKAQDIGKEIRYLDREIDATDNYLLDLSIKVQEKIDELTQLQKDSDKYLQEIKNAGWEEIYCCERDRQTVQWVKKEEGTASEQKEQ